MRFLPDNAGRWGYVDLNADFRSWSPGGMPPGPDTSWMAGMVADLHQRRGIDHSYGGYLERRDDLLAHTYLAEEKKYLHLGVDLNVPAGSRVTASRAGWVVAVDDDAPEPHGWGPRIIVRVRDAPRFRSFVYLIYAHLDPDIPVRSGEMVTPGQVLASVGSPGHNGGWFSHLHVQAVTQEAWDRLDLRTLDGYGLPDRAADLALDFPDPLPILVG